MDFERRLAAAGIDPDAVSDLDVLRRFSDPVAEWWIETFGAYVEENDGLFTPPQRQAIPHIDEGTNTLICAPTGSGKCLAPEVPLLVERDGTASVVRAADLDTMANERLATIADGALYDADIGAHAYDAVADELAPTEGFVYTEPYEGPLVQLETATGRQVTVTPDHPLLVADGPAWQSAGDIETGDRIAMPDRIDLPAEPQPVATEAAIDRLQSRGLAANATDHGTIAVRLSSGERIYYHYPTTVTPATGRLIGVLAVAGVTERDADGHLERLAVPDTEARRIAADALESTVDTAGRLRTDGVLTDPVLLALLEGLLAPETGLGRQQPLPSWCLNAPQAVKRALLEAVLTTADGHDDRHIQCHTAIGREQLNYLLLAVGITPHLDRATNTLVVDAADATQVSRHSDTPAAVRADGGPRGVSDPLRFDQVVAVERVAHDGPIVDLSVPDLHNFVGGSGGLLLHNTLASFSKIIDDLARRDADDGLKNSVYCLYVSPLKSLANDIHRNLTQPLSEIKATEGDLGIRHAIRHGDTDSSERQRMLEETPHILNTTPETLAILLNSPKFREKLRTVEYVIVDEIHAIAESKRGTHLAVSLERLEALAEGSPTRIGCSATIEPLEAVGEFLVGRESPGGPSRPFEVVDTRFAREYDLRLLSPTDDLINTPREVITERFYDRLDQLIQGHTNTIVFANTRSGAERILHNLREHYDYDESNSGCHHGSLSKTQRERIEAGLKDGAFDVVTSSTSLALGIDMPEVDLVIQVGSPKSVAELLQRIGRAGHRVGQTVTGRVIALDRDELIECAVMLKKAKEGFVDSVSIPENAQDVAAQHVYGMAIAEIRPEREVRRILRQAYPYREYTDAAYEQLMRYLTADYEGLEDRDVYAKVWRDTNDPPDGEHHYEEFPVGEPLIGKRGRLARMIYMTNIGTIPDSFSVDVFTRSDDEWVGDLDEEYLDTLESGDVFVLGGERFEYQYRRGSKVYVDRTAARPTVPSWYSERLPLSFDLGREILRFQGALLDHLEADGPVGVRAWLRTFPLDDDSVRALTRLYDAQRRYAGSESVSTDRRVVIEVERDREAYRRHYHVRTGYGRRFNDGLSRLLAYHAAQETTANVSIAVADHGFTLTMPLNRKVDLVELIESLDPAAVRSDLRASLDGTDLLKRYFRIDATRALMILKRYKGHEKSASQQQVSSEMLLSFAEDLEDFAVIEETYREILEDKLNIEAIEWFCQRVQAGDLAVVAQTLETPSPRSFGLATLAASDVVLAEDESAVLQEFHQRVMDEIGDPTDGALADES